jgi:hypothetical protein
MAENMDVRFGDNNQFLLGEAVQNKASMDSSALSKIGSRVIRKMTRVPIRLFACVISIEPNLLTSVQIWKDRMMERYH